MTRYNSLVLVHGDADTPKKKPASPPRNSFFPIRAQKMIPKPTTPSIGSSSQTISADPTTFN
jgi:hypothetical protein